MITSFLELLRYRGLLWNLILRDIRIRYKQAFLGVGWAIFQPLCLMLIFTFAFSKVGKVQTGSIPYPLFVFSGLVPWQFFQLGLATATGSLVQNMSLVTKIYSPRKIFPLAAMLSKLLDFLVGLVALMVLMIYFGIPFHATILWLPFLLGVQLVFMSGLGLLAAMGNLFFRDVGYIINTLLMFWMFATPVAYPLPAHGGLSLALFYLNPLTPIVDAYRSVLLYGVAPAWKELLPSAFISLTILVLGWYWFERLQYLFAERI